MSGEHNSVPPTPAEKKKGKDDTLPATAEQKHGPEDGSHSTTTAKGQEEEQDSISPTTAARKGEEDTPVPPTPKEKKRGDQSDLVQGLRVVYDILSSHSKQENYSADQRKSRLKGSTAESNEIVDIVAVPGLGADPSITWLKRSTLDQEELRAAQDSGGPTFKDGPSCIEDSLMLQAELPKSRIMIFQYVSQWWGESAVDQYLHQVAENLARALKNKRKSCPKRPIIFIGHSLGGIVIEKTILWAKLGGLEYADVFDSITGCVFLGTPFKGSESQAYAAVTARALSTKGIEKAEFNSLLEVLKTGNQYLVSLLDDFLKIVVEAGILTHCFIELKKTNLTKFIGKWLSSIFSTVRVIADSEAASLHGRPKTTLNVDHSGLNKFDGPTDENWMEVCNAIKDIARKSAKIVKSRQNALPETLDDTKYQEIMRALSLSETDPEDDIFSIREQRGDAIDAASKLVLENKKISSFLTDDQQGALWVDLHSGMDTEMTAVAFHQELKTIRNRNSGDQNDRQLCYFFCDDTDLRKNNTLSVLKAFIRQMIGQSRRLALHLPWDQKSLKGRVTFDSADALIGPFLAMLRDKSVGNIDILINNLHMIDSGDRQKLLHAFSLSVATQSQSERRIDENAKVRWVCIGRGADRHDLNNAMGIAIHISSADLGSPERLRDALKTLVAQRVRQLALALGYKRDIVFWLRNELLRRAEGNATWVDLACSEIFCVRPEPIDVRSFAESLKQGLTPLYRQIENRVMDTNNPTIEYTKEILRTMMIVVQHPTPNELAVLANLPDHLYHDTKEIVEIVKRCGSFLVIRSDPKNKDSLHVEFMDVSAREYLQRESSAVLGLSSEETQHGVLALRCLTYLMGQAVASGLDQNHFTHFGDHRSRTRSSIEYPSRYWINHAMKADNTDVVEDFDLEDDWWHNQREPFAPWWPKLSELARSLPSIEGLTVVHLAAYFNYPVLLEHLLKSDRFRLHLESEDATGRRPLSWAVRAGHMEATMILVERGANVGAPCSRKRKGFTAVHDAVISGRLELVKYLVRHGANLESPIGLSMCLAAAESTPDVVTYLLSLGSSLEIPTDAPYGNAVGAACASGNVQIIRSIVEKGCNVNIRDENEIFPLVKVANNAEAVSLLVAHGASKEHRQAGLEEALKFPDNIASVRILLEKGRDLDLKVPFLKAAYHSQHGLFDLFPRDRLEPDILAEALFLASESNSAATVRSLLEIGADPKKGSQSNTNRYALAAAAANGSTEIIRTLLDAKADPSIVDELHGTALQAACFEGNVDNVRLLLPGSDRKARLCGPFGTALCAAIRGHHKNVVDVLLDEGWDVNDNNKQVDRPIPILVAAAEGHLDIIELLLERNVDVKVTDQDGSTPLILGARTLPTRGIKKLVQRGCDIAVQNLDGINPLIAASQGRAAQTVQYLLDENAKRGFFSKKININHLVEGRSALHIAARNGDAETCRILIDANAIIKSGGTNDTPPITYSAAASGDFETFNLTFVEYGGEPIDKKRWGDILAPAMVGGNRLLCQFLLRRPDRDINAMLNEGDGPALHTACLHNLPDLVEGILHQGADPNVEGGRYHTALQAAAFRGNPDIVQMLLDQPDLDALSSPGGFYGNALNAAASKNHVVVMRMLIEATQPSNKDYFEALLKAAQFRAETGVDFLLRTMMDNKIKETGLHGTKKKELEKRSRDLKTQLFRIFESYSDEDRQNDDDFLIEKDQRVDPEDEEPNSEDFPGENETDEGEFSAEDIDQEGEDGLFVVDDIRRMLQGARTRR